MIYINEMWTRDTFEDPLWEYQAHRGPSKVSRVHISLMHHMARSLLYLQDSLQESLITSQGKGSVKTTAQRKMGDASKAEELSQQGA